jgi:hypothetical protein
VVHSAKGSSSKRSWQKATSHVPINLQLKIVRRIRPETGLFRLMIMKRALAETVVSSR